MVSVYGPVNSWRYGRSLGIDPIGAVSTCSFNCAYCQLGEIEHLTIARQIFVPTEQIMRDLETFAPWNVDAITLSGSGEPTLALNLAEILFAVKELTQKRLVVLTNGTKLCDRSVRDALTIADRIAVKLDAVSPEQLRRINRPVKGVNLPEIWQGLQQFRASYQGKLAIQTMILFPWNEATQTEYIDRIRFLAPDEIQLNTPARPKPLTHQLEARGNHQAEELAYPVQMLKCVSAEELQAFAEKIHSQTGIPVRWKAETR